mgnify:CR=1 FL=1
MYGTYTTMPINAAIQANTNVAALEQSLAIFANGCSSNVIKSTTASIAEFINSADRTIPIANKVINHSIPDTWKNILANNTHIVAITWINILCSYLYAYFNPSIEYLKLLKTQSFVHLKVRFRLI